MNIFFKIILLIILITISSCRDNISITADDIDILQWNDLTISYALDKCSLMKNEYNQKGMPLTVDLKNNKIGIKDDFYNFLKKRDLFFKNNISFNSQEHVIIEEIYDRGQGIGDIRSSLSFNIDSTSYKYFISSNDEIKEKKNDNYDINDYEMYANMNYCTNQLKVGDLLDAIIIVTNISKNKKGEIKYEILYFSLSSTIH